MRATDFITEIEAIPAWQYAGGEEVLQDFNNINISTLKPLPGNNQFQYAVEQAGHMTRLLIVDPKNPTDAIAMLEVNKDDLPIRGNPVSVETITVDKRYRGRGLSKALYSLILKDMKRPLIAGYAQTPGGRRNWLSLVNMPGVEVKGVIQMNNNSFDPSKAASGSKHEKNIEKNMDSVMELGGQFIGKDKYASYWAFDVVPGKGQLAPYIKNSLSRIYGYDAPTTMLARYVGK